MATKPTEKAGDVLADARKVIAAARARFAEFKKADAGRKVKLLTLEFVKELEGKLKQAERTVGDSGAVKSAVKAATDAERKLREELVGALKNIRDGVSLAYPDDKPLARAFGVGRKLASKSTADVLAAAETVKSAYAEKQARAKAVAAGVSASAIAALDKLSARLADADTTQNTRMSARKGTSAGKDELLRALKAGTARIRKVASHVLPKNALAAFKSTLPRRTPKPRKAPTAPAPSTPPTG